MSGERDGPCAHHVPAGPASTVPPPAGSPAPAHLPVVRLHELLDDVAATYAWYARLFPRKVWASRPDPIAACQELSETIDQLECMIDAAREAKRHCQLLFDLSSQEAARQRGYPW